MKIEFKNGSVIDTLDTRLKNIKPNINTQLIGYDIAPKGSTDHSAVVSRCMSCNTVIELLTGDFKDLKPTQFHECPNCGVRFNMWYCP